MHAVPFYGITNTVYIENSRTNIIQLNSTQL